VTQLDETSVMLALTLCHERGLLPSADRAWAAETLALRQAQGYLEPVRLNAAATMLHRHRQIATEHGIPLPELPAAANAETAGASMPGPTAPTGPKVEVTIAGSGELMVSGAPFEMNPVWKTQPGHRYDRPSRSWRFTPAPAVAAAVGNAIRAHGCRLAMGPKARALAVEHTRRRDTAALLDPSAAVPDIDWARSVTRKPWDHQLRQAQFQLDSTASLIAVPMGGGKTAGTVLALNESAATRVLTVCPNKVRGVWGRELAKHSTRPWHVVDGRRESRRAKAGFVDLSVPERQRELEEALFDCTCGRPHMAAINYEVLTDDLWEGWAPRERFDWIVYDEVHRLKSHKMYTKGGQGAARTYSVSGRAASWVQFADKRTGLSGTPISTDPAEDAFSVYRALDPGIFGTTWTQHDAHYRIKNPKIADHVIGYRNLAELARKLSLIMYRPQVQLDLPPAVSETVEVELDKPTMAAYREMEADLATDLAAFIDPTSPSSVKAVRERIARQVRERARRSRNEVDPARVETLIEKMTQEALDDPDTGLTAANPMVKLLRLQQLTGGVLATDEGVEARVWDSGKGGTKPSPKGEALAEVLTQVGCIPDRTQWSALANGGRGDYVDAEPEPVVVICRFSSDLAQVREIATARGLRYGEISGNRTDGLTRDSLLSPDVDVCGVQIQAGGTGIELVRARIVVWWSVGYSLVDFDQAMKRVHRPGQTRPVLNVFLVAKGTADEAVYEALDGRRSTVANVFRLAGFPDEQVDTLVAGTSALAEGEHVDGADSDVPGAPELESDAEPGRVVVDMPFLDADRLSDEPVYLRRQRKRRPGAPTKPKAREPQAYPGSRADEIDALFEAM
jgi:hypothetical protein